MFNYLHVHFLSFHLLQVLFILPVFVCSPILEEIKYLSTFYKFVRCTDNLLCAQNFEEQSDKAIAIN